MSQATSDGTNGKRKRGSNAQKFYAVRYGKKPGVYNSWEECLEQVTGAKGAMYKSFTSAEDARVFVKSKGPFTPSGPPKFYAVRRGYVPGVFDNWPAAQAQVVGFPKPEHKSFKTREEAEAYFAGFSHHAAKPQAAKKIKVTEESGVAAQEAESVPIDTEDGFDSTIILDTSTGQVRKKTAQELNTLRAVSRHGPASTGKSIKIYTDGACRSNGQRGAIAGVGVWFGPNDDRNVSERLAGDRQTNQRAELTALKRALDMCPMHRNAHIFSDSTYAINCVTQWFVSWERTGWRTSAGKVVENRDLVEAIIQRIRDREACKAKTTFEWVKGHASNSGNIEADRLAVQGSTARSPPKSQQTEPDIASDSFQLVDQEI